MALVTVQRSPSPSGTTETDETDTAEAEESSKSAKSPRQRRRRSKSSLKKLRKLFNTVRFVTRLKPCFSENYFTVKGAALILPQSDYDTTFTRKVTKSHGGDIQEHLQAMFSLLRPQDTIKVAVRLENVSIRYLVVVSCIGRQDTEESVILGMDLKSEPSIGLILPLWAHTHIKLDGDGGFSVGLDSRFHVFKPVSVQAMWSVLQSLNKVVKIAMDNLYLPNGLTHTWVGYYEAKLSRDNFFVSEWNVMTDVDKSYRTDPKQINSTDNDFYKSIKTELRHVLMNVDLEEVTCKYVREELEARMKMDLRPFRTLIDTEMFEVLGQMDAPTKILDFLYLGSEWNASNLEELQRNGVNNILNISREIDNFFPGVLHYMNIREWDVERSDLLKYWKDSHKFIEKARKRGGKTLVHCKMGISRSASTVMAYLMKENCWSRQEAYDFVKAKRNIVNPNTGFWDQLETYEGILTAKRTYPTVISKHPGPPALQEKDEEDDTEADAQFTLSAAEMIAIKTGQLSTVGDLILPMEPDLEVGSRSDSTEELLQHDQVASGSASRGHQRSSESTTQTSDSDSDSDSTESSLFEGENEKLETGKKEGQMGFVPIDIPKIATPAEPGSPDVIKVESRRSAESDADKLLHSLGVEQPGVSRDSREGSMTRFRPDGSWIKLEMEEEENSEENSDEKMEPDTSTPETVQSGGIEINFDTVTETQSELPVEGFPEKFEKDKHDETAAEDDNVCVSMEKEEDKGQPLNSAIEESENGKLMDTEEGKEFSDQSGSVGEDPSLEHGVKHHYTKENIPWSPGTVKKQKIELEEKFKTDEKTRKKTDSCGSPDLHQYIADDKSPTVTPPGGDAVTKGEVTDLVEKNISDIPTVPVTQEEADESLHKDGEDAQSTSPAGTSELKGSVYEQEEIPIAPGTVKRTLQEIEERNKLLASTPRRIQRSSSLKSRRVTPKAKDRNNERRKTCMAILSPTSSDVSSRKEEETKREITQFADNLLPPATKDPQCGEDTTTAAHETGSVKVYKFLGEEVTVQEGLVRRQTLGIEQKGHEVVITKPVKLDFDAEQKSDDSAHGAQSSALTSDCDTSDINNKQVLPTHILNQVTPELTVSKSHMQSVPQTIDPDEVSLQFCHMEKSPGEGEFRHVEPIEDCSNIKPSQFLEKTKILNSASNSIPDPVTPVSSKRRGVTKQESRFDEETLVLIREIGSALLNSPAKVELEVETEAPLEGGSLVSHYVRRLERRVIKGARKNLTKEIIIIDKDTQERKQHRYGQTASASISQPCDKDTSSPGQACDRAQWPPLDASSALQRSCDPASLSLDLQSNTQTVSQAVQQSDQSSTPSSVKSETCSVKNLVGKFEHPDPTSTSAGSTPLSSSVCSPSAFVPSFPADVEIIDRAPSGGKLQKQERIIPEDDGTEIQRQSEPVIKLSEKSMAMFAKVLSPTTEDEPGSGDSILRNIGRSASQDTAVARPKSADHRLLSSSKSFHHGRRSLLTSRTLPDSEQNETSFTWEGRKVRKNYGKSHPLARLEQQSSLEGTRNTPFYSTM